MTATHWLSLIIAAAILAVASLALWAQYAMSSAQIWDRQAGLVRADLDGLLAHYDQRRIPGMRQAIEFRLLGSQPGLHQMSLRDRHRVELGGNFPTWPNDVAVPQHPSQAPPVLHQLGGQQHLLLARELPGGFSVLVSRSTNDLQQALAKQRGLIFGGLAVAAILSLVLGQLASRWVLTRVRRINDLADRVAGGDMSARLPGPRPADEFGSLETHIHAMLDRIAALDHARNHLADTIAHELRTPLNRIQQRIVDLQTPDSDALHDEIRSTIRIFDSLLEITRAEAETGQRPGLLSLDLADLTRDVVELYAPLAEDKGIALTGGLTGQHPILGDRNLVAQLLSNLLDNAIKFCASGDRVVVDLTASGKRTELRIADTGPGLRGADPAKVFDRFNRGVGDDRTPGHGLGLSLVRAIAMCHGAKLNIPHVKEGFTIIIIWPLQELQTIPAET